MGSFALVVAGNPTMATDINQYGNILNGTTVGGQLNINGGTATAPYIGFFTAAPTTATPYLYGYVTGDTTSRIFVGVGVPSNGSTGQISWGDGTHYKGSIIGENNGTGTGIFSDQHFRFVLGAQVANGLTVDTMTASGNVNISGSATVSGEPVLVNASQGTLCQIFSGTNPPTGMNTGDFWIKG